MRVIALGLVAGSAPTGLEQADLCAMELIFRRRYRTAGSAPTLMCCCGDAGCCSGGASLHALAVPLGDVLILLVKPRCFKLVDA